MPYSLTVRPADQLGVVTFAGAVTGEDLVGALHDLYADAAWAPGFDALWDFGGIDELILHPGDLQALVALDFAYEDVGGAGRDAVVVTRDLDRFIGKLFERLSEATPRPNRVCRSLDEAWTWMGRPAEGRAA